MDNPDQFGIPNKNTALQKAFLYIIQKDFYGGYKIKDNYLIAFSLEFARNLTYPGDGTPQWQAIGQDNAHIGIAVHDEADLHFITGLSVTVTVLDHNEYLIGSYKHPLLHRPNFHHYGRNWKLPGDGLYTLRIRVETPPNMLRDEANRRIYSARVDVEFRNIAIKTGQKTR